MSAPVDIYLDVESDPLAEFVYLIGLIVVQDGSSYTRSFWADSKDEELRIFEEFVAEVTRHRDFLVFCYGSHERSFITRLRTGAQSQAAVDSILERLVNILSVVYAHLYFPTYSNGLKDVGRCVGCSWTEPTASGIQSIVWRSRWETSCAEEWKERLRTYNLEDYFALKRVTEIVRTISTGGTSEDEPLPDNRDRPPIAFLKDIEKLSDYRRWKRIDFVDPAYDYVNSRSYFDYQRERVYIRTGKSARKRRSTRAGSPNHPRPGSQRRRMKQYLLSVITPEGDPPPPKVLEPIMRDVEAVRQEMLAASAWVFSGGLNAPSTATVLRPRGGEVLVTDGPFAEGKEYLGGFSIIRCRTRPCSERGRVRISAAQP